MHCYIDSIDIYIYDNDESFQIQDGVPNHDFK